MIEDFEYPDADAGEEQDCWFPPAGSSNRNPPLPEVQNPILTAVRDALRRHGCRHVFIMTGKGISEKAAEKWFGSELMPTLGRMLFDAIVSGDAEFSEKVREAIREADILFRRDKEANLVPRFFRYVEGLPDPLPTLGEIKRGFEKSLGKKLSGRQWQNLRGAMYLDRHPRGKSGRRKQ